MLGLAAAVMLQGAGAAPSLITNPDWAMRPRAQDIARHFPKKAIVEARSGRATIACLVSVEGGLFDCAVAQETPEALGFGEAALNVAEYFKMKPMLRDGVAIEGGRVRVPIVFVSPTDAAAAPVYLKNDGLAGAAVDLNCRYHDQSVDDCVLVGVRGHYSPAARDAAIAWAIRVQLGRTAKPMGRILFSISFVAGDAP